MTTTEAVSSSSSVHTHCPLCGAELHHPEACDRCDWVKGYRHRTNERGSRDLVALLMSIVPGFGHLYKGQLVPGIAFLVGSVPVVFLISLIAAATMGFGLLLLPLYWIWVMSQAYWAEDLHDPTRTQAVEDAGERGG